MVEILTDDRVSEANQSRFRKISKKQRFYPHFVQNIYDHGRDLSRSFLPIRSPRRPWAIRNSIQTTCNYLLLSKYQNVPPTEYLWGHEELFSDYCPDQKRQSFVGFV